MKRHFITACILALATFLGMPASLWAQSADNEPDDRNIVIYGKGNQVLYSVKTSEVDSIVFADPLPAADMLDVVFHEDGTAEDVSPMKNEVKLVGNTSYTRFSKAYNRYMATFTNPWAGTATGYYRIDYDQNQEFRSKLADGHTLEVLFMPNYSGTIPNQECKPFSAMQSGGTGFLVTTTSGARKNEICFLPNTSTNGKSTWRWATSGIVPQPKVYYHVVGVWNKQEGKAYVYVNGELKNTIDAPGNFNFASSGNAPDVVNGNAPGNMANCMQDGVRGNPAYRKMQPTRSGDTNAGISADANADACAHTSDSVGAHTSVHTGTDAGAHIMARTIAGTSVPAALRIAEALCMLLLGSAHIGEVQASVWDEATRAACAKAGIPLL